MTQQLNFLDQHEAHQQRAAERLAEMVARNVQSFEGRDYCRRRAAALKHTRAIGT